MISARLAIKRRPDGVTFTILHLAEVLKGLVLPSHKGIIIWVHISGDEGSSPISTKSHQFGVTLKNEIIRNEKKQTCRVKIKYLAERREIREPVLGISEFGDLIIFDS